MRVIALIVNLVRRYAGGLRQCGMVRMPLAHEVSLHGTDEQLGIIGTGGIAISVSMTIGWDLKVQVGPQRVECDGLGKVHCSDERLHGGASECLCTLSADDADRLQEYSLGEAWDHVSRGPPEAGSQTPP